MTGGARRARSPAPPLSRRRVLLDTQVWLWWQADDRRLGPAARAVIAGGEVYFSAASAWEIAIKAGLGKLHLPATYDIGAELELDGFHPLPIDLVHARAAGVLPLIHRDPFDRMLIAQARCEGLVLATGNSEMSRYDVPVLAVDG